MIRVKQLPQVTSQAQASTEVDVTPKEDSEASPPEIAGPSTGSF